MAFGDDDFLAPQGVLTTNVVWLDVNTSLGLNGRPDLLSNVRALINSLFNLFQCPVGARGPIFEPEFGSILMYMLQEALDAISANKIKAGVLQAIQRWEPRIEVDMAHTRVTPDYNRNAFNVLLVFNIVATQQIAQENFFLNRT
jgi:phage baseplate assembly protein W